MECRDRTSQLPSIATDLFPTPCLNPHGSKEFRGLAPASARMNAGHPLKKREHREADFFTTHAKPRAESDILR